ncbi:hypothetical protein D8I24_1117 [Cupriavidus necator H850]|nr:hypothetical protein D8I24_1117 [Cupriavidus necator H850]
MGLPPLRDSMAVHGTGMNDVVTGYYLHRSRLVYHARRLIFQD